MNKKKLVLDVLNKLLPYRPMAEWIIALIESKYADEKIIDDLLIIISKAIKSTKKESEKTKLEKASKTIKKIKEVEKKQKKQESEEIEKMIKEI